MASLRLRRNKMSVIDPSVHRAVVITGDVNYAFGFRSIADAVEFVENQIPEAISDKAVGIITNTLSDGERINDLSYQIMDVDSYMDIYGDVDDEDE